MDNDYYFYSKLTNKKYCAISSIDLKLFENELKDNNMTIEEYCEKFLKNIAHEKHLNRCLKEDELYVIKNIKLVKGTYEKIIVNKQFKCEICKNFFAASKPSFVSHIKRFHKIDSLSSYFKQIGYEEINPKYELCNFCKKNEAEYNLEWDINLKIFEKIYNGYICNKIECKDKICQDFFGKSYTESKKQYEHIGGYTSFLCKKYKTDEKGLIKIGKSKRAKTFSNWKSNLHGFISKYGLEEGTKKYNERCKAISKAQKIEWFIEKYGKIEGPKKYFEKQEKISNFHKRNTNITSKGERDLYNLIRFEYDDAKLEYPTNYGIIDIFIPEKNVIIEYYGDYWHCNPKYYDENFYHKNLEMTAKEKHIFDENKNKRYLENIKNSKIIIIWESSFKLMNDENKLTLLKNIKNFSESSLTIGKILWV